MLLESHCVHRCQEASIWENRNRGVPWGALGSSEAALTVVAVLLPFSTGSPSKLPVIWFGSKSVWDVRSCLLSSIEFVLDRLHPMSKPWGQRVPNKKPAGSQRSLPARAAPEFFRIHRGQAEGVHNSQKYPLSADLGGWESPARAEV